ncbi:MAG: acyltransferase family protein [Oscillospiraceae bacterium]|nr:acyltransferase family protein [Oscillospiraceae bacterium]
MFASLRRNRSLLMGLAILGITFYHAPFVIHNSWIRLFHDVLYCGVDLFLFYSGIGACHSIEKSGGRAYLGKRAKRLLPGLIPVLWGWSLLMLGKGVFTGKQFLGSVTLLGWWFGSQMQLNWYFSAVWLFFVLAIPLYGLFRKTKYPAVLWAGAVLVLSLLCVFGRLPYNVEMLTARMTVFLTGMLFGRLEQRGFEKTGRITILAMAAMAVGILVVIASERYIAPRYGYVYGLGWLPFLLVIPGGSILTGKLADALRKTRLRVLMKPIEWVGQASGEILMVHMAVYKTILVFGKLANAGWLMVLAGCVVLGICYYHLINYAVGLIETRKAKGVT